ncbi:ATP-binding protein [Nocardioides caldifontis]|uniref:ATP-binding protein n=1 Tax=Nocardioides caldifontis TaxID=2588938 RepID=UPI0011DF8247|nr:AAA family ATPase [Nocardioides caldifontis]
MTTTALGSTPFTGRRRELGEIQRALTTARCVTLIGFGGAGKTRLARQVLRELGATTTTWWVGLGDLRDPATVHLTVAEALGLHPHPGTSQVRLLAESIGDQPAVLCLDNCEHLLDSCTVLVAELLASCPGLRVLTTSRQPLGLAGELVYRVPPLALPGPEDDLDALRSSEAVALFAARAAEALPGFEVDHANAAAVARLCTELEGVPLALELAAARIRALSPQEMLAARVARWSYSAPCSPGSATATGCSAAATWTPPTGSGPWRPRSPGATTSAPARSSCCGSGCRFSLPGSTSVTPSTPAPTHSSPARR